MKWCQNCQRHGAQGHRVGECKEERCNRCPWPGCPCTHDGGCDRGFIEVTPDDDASMAQVRKCPTCQEWASVMALHPTQKNLRAVAS